MRIRRYLHQSLYTISILLFLFGVLPEAMAADVSLAWDPSVSSNITGYKIYIGSSSGNYSTTVTIGNQTTYTLTGLSAGTYYFAVTAYDANGNESGYSNEVSKVISSSGPNCNINGDSSVNALDLQLLANGILGITTVPGSSDLNSDGKIDVLDLQILNNVILGLRSCP